MRVKGYTAHFKLALPTDANFAQQKKLKTFQFVELKRSISELYNG